MKLRLNLSLIFVGLAVLSCGGFGSEVSPAIGLPHVSSPRPVQIGAVKPAALLAEPSSLQSEVSLVKARVLAHLMAHHTGLAPEELPRLAETIVDEAERYDLEPALVVAVIQVESAFYHRAVSSVGALGLMQILPSTGEELAHKADLPWRGPDSLFDPILNVKLGVAYIAQLESSFGEMPAALAAYNWGPRRIRERLQRGHSLPAEYVRRVMTSYDRADQSLDRT